MKSLIEQSEAEKFTMGVSLWNKDSQKFVWEGTYKMKPPGGYEIDTAKLYSTEFMDKVLEDIKKDQ